MFDNFSLVTCNYGTPHITETMLKSWKVINGEVSNKLFMVDNSVDNDSEEMLKSNLIEYARRVNGKHFEGVQHILNNVETRYVLLVDTDVIFNKNITPMLNFFIEGKYAIMGEVCGDRGGQILYPRIHPWFCFIDIKQIRDNRISFVNHAKVANTGSGGFYGNGALDNNSRRNRKYDVGATFLEDIIQRGLKAYNKKMDPEYYFHYEGMSWRGASGIPSLVNAQKENEILYQMDYEKYKDVDIIGWYK